MSSMKVSRLGHIEMNIQEKTETWMYGLDLKLYINMSDLIVLNMNTPIVICI